jgi:hypothetical protein
VNYKFLRARPEHERDLMFRRLENIGAVDLGKYAAIYEGDVDGQDDETVLEDLFRTFNIDHPADFRAPSMSVGDIVMLDRSRLWFCDSFGWVELKGENAPVAYSVLVLDVSGRAAR